MIVTKRLFDLTISTAALIATAPLLAALIVAATLETRANGLFRQHRIGRGGEVFTVLKIRTMSSAQGHQSTVTALDDDRITPLGAQLRSWKLDELPQLWNIATGSMSFVGPRPDVPGYADELQGEDRKVLELRPGITGPASVLFRDEETLLAQVEDPQRFNDDVLWPTKVRINRAYAEAASFRDDLALIRMTLRRDVVALGEMLGRWDHSLVCDPTIAQALSKSATSNRKPL